uniref:Uncharacterized protein n=1 Tax=viral metagenome TaxID=1070528 RepID=A0A6C0C7B0_9ZZZZ
MFLSKNVDNYDMFLNFNGPIIIILICSLSGMTFRFLNVIFISLSDIDIKISCKDRTSLPMVAIYHFFVVALKIDKLIQFCILI